MKTDEHGHECPEWCVSAHTEPDAWISCEGERRRTPNSMARADIDFDRKPEVIAVAVGTGKGGLIHAGTAYRAKEVAAFIEAVTMMPRAEARRFAANVRTAAAEAWPQKEAEAG